MKKLQDKNKIRVNRHRRIRNKLSGVATRPRLCVYRSSKNIYAQIIDDVNGTTLVSASTKDKELAGKVSEMTKVEAAKEIGATLAKRAIEKNIKTVVFDRGGYVYHGRVQSLAEGARENGLEF